MLPYSQKDYADIIKLGILRWKNYPGLFDGPNVITRVFIRRRHDSQSQKVGVMEAEVVTVHFESGGRDHHPKNIGNF